MSREMKTTKVKARYLCLWRPGMRPTTISVGLKPLWSWPLALRRALWQRRVHPRAVPCRYEILSDVDVKQ